ncbi:MAG TPA: DUF5677 domain-containing protein [Candidatus Polarisedimenticolaceae bacterium]|nr:DUF5677 domain-containing protein [Candidatus Polarisedimenticolaceae bacterium]
MKSNGSSLGKDKLRQAMLLTMVMNAQYILKECATMSSGSNIERQINMGLLVKASKLYGSITSTKRLQDDDSQTIQISMRTLFEVCLSLIYLVINEDEELYKEFVLTDMMRRRNMRDATLASPLSQSHPLMKKTVKDIEDSIRTEGFDPEQLPKGYPQSWHRSISYARMAREAGPELENMYSTFYGLSSSISHPSWQDLTRSHLKPSNVSGTMNPNFEFIPVMELDVEMSTCIVLGAAYPFALKFAPKNSIQADHISKIHDNLHKQRLLAWEAIA